MHHYISLGNDALYRFPTKSHFLQFCKSRAMAEPSQRDAIRPQLFGAEMVGRVWVMRDAGAQDWEDMVLLAESL